MDDGTKSRMGDGEVKGLEGCGVSMNLELENLVDLDAFSEGSILHHVRKR